MKELFQSLSSQAVAAAQAVPFRIRHNDLTKAKYFVCGEYREVDLGTPPVEIVLFDFDDFVSILNDKSAAEVYVQITENGIQANGLLDPANTGRVIFYANWSVLFRAVQAIGQKIFDQRSIVRLLSQDFRDCVPANLAALLRSIDVTAATHSQISQGKERGTKEFAVQAAEELPEVFPLVVPVIDECGISDRCVTIAMGLDVNLPPQPTGFLMRALPGEIEAAKIGICNLVTMSLSDREHCSNWSKKVYAGVPTAAPIHLD